MYHNLLSAAALVYNAPSMLRATRSASPALRVALALGCAALTAAATTAGPATAHAAPSDKAAKKAAKKALKKAKGFEKKGKKAYKKGRYDDAIVAFELAFKTHPDPRYLYNIGKCHEQKGDLFRAMEHIERYADLAEDEDEAEDARQSKEILGAKLAKTSGEVSLTTTPPDATVLLKGPDKEMTGQTPWGRWLPAGRWKVEFALQDHLTQEREIVVAAGKRVTVEVTLTSKAQAEAEAKAKADAAAKAKADAEAKAQAEAEAKAQAERAAAERQRAAQAAATRRMWSWTALGAGAALAAGGAFFGMQAAEHEANVDAFRSEEGHGSFDDAQKEQDAAEGQALIANVLVGSALVAAGVGGWLMVTVDEGAATVAAGGTF